MVASVTGFNVTNNGTTAVSYTRLGVTNSLASRTTVQITITGLYSFSINGVSVVTINFTTGNVSVSSGTAGTGNLTIAMTVS